MGDSMTFKGLCAVIAVCATLVAIALIIADVQRTAIEKGIYQDAHGNWVSPVSAETVTHSSDCRPIDPPRLPAAVPEPLPVPIPLDAGESHFQQREAVHRVDY